MSSEFDDFYQQPRAWVQRTSGDSRQAADGETMVGSGPYKPFGHTPVNDHESCDVMWWLKGSIPQGQEIQYRFLVRVGYLGDENLHLMLTDCIIHIEGRNLRELRKSLTRRKVTFIQAFNAAIWPQPPADEPVITSISLLYPGETQRQ